MTNEACCRGTGERSVVCTITLRIAGKVLPFASFAVRRSPLARAAKNGQFWPVFGPFSCAAAIVASGAKRQPSQHPGTPRVAQGWMGLSYSREGAARRFVRSPPLAARSGGPKRPVLACFWAVLACCGGRGERSSGRGIRAAGKVLPFASFAVRRSPLAQAAKNGQFWPVFGPFSRAAATAASGAKRQPSQHRGTPRVAQGWMGLSYSREGAARRFVRSPPLAARSGGPKRPVLACFWAVLACCGGRGERSSGRGIRAAGKVLPFASFAVRRSPLARAAKNGQFWPVFGPFSRAAATAASGAKRQPSQHPGTPRVAQGWMGLSYSREGAARRFVRSPPLAARSGGPKRPVLACFWAVFACCGGRGERSSGRGIGVAGKVLPFASFSVRRSPLARAAKNGQFWPVFGPFSRAAATAASGAKRQPSQHPGTPRVAQGWMGLSYSREGAARRFVRSPPLAVRSCGPKRPVLACFWAVFVCCGGRGERSSGRGIGVAGKVLPFASFAVRRSPLARAAKNGQFWPVFGPFSRAAATVASGAKRQPSQHPGTPRVAQGWMGLSYSREGAARRFVRSPPLAARSGGRKRPVLACFWAVFACRGGARERSSGRGIGVAGKVLPFASFAVRRSPLARVAKNGQFWPVFGPFSRAAAIAARSGCPKRAVLACFWAVFACCGGRGERSSGRGIRVAGKVLLPFASFADRRSPLARAAKNGQFWPVFGPFSRPAVTLASGAKRQPSQHPGTPRVAQGWMGLSYSREGAARCFVRSPPLAARSGGPKRAVLACFWAVFACCGGRCERSSGRGIRVAGKVLPFASFAVRRSPLARVAKNGQFWPVFGPFSRAAATAASGAKRQPSQHPGTPRVAQGWMGLSYSREGAARRFVRSPPLAARSGGPKRAVLACFWAVFVCCGGRGERSSGRGIRVAGKVLPFPLFPLRSLGRHKTASFGLYLGCFCVLR
ncbi:hypothetical protein OPV22_034753 [Ensete ventricosum]|uniref:Uncharacterized protein n=2 Tax=Ensete ventricosum TaxID=4639 RepID=A0AAV8PMK2_ENSVE|nr:hypothetical protein OPV22_034753 [Ensete ventricosum]